MRAGIVIALLACSGPAHDDAPRDMTVSLGPVQCRTSEECISLTGAGCFMARPGGVCANCSDVGDVCPQGTECVTGGTSGATECAFICSTDADCNIGMACVTTGALVGHCQPRACGPGLPPCPSPYTFCRATTAQLSECSRPMCSDGCVAPLICPPQGAFCVEP